MRGFRISGVSLEIVTVSGSSKGYFQVLASWACGLREELIKESKAESRQAIDHLSDENG